MIKIIKRGIVGEAHLKCEPESAATALAAARLRKREIVRTITGWIDERLENHRLAEIVARKNPLSELAASSE